MQLKSRRRQTQKAPSSTVSTWRWTDGAVSLGASAVGVTHDGIGVGVDDDRGVRTMPRQRDAAFKPVRLHAAVLTSGWAAC